ncbi:MAG: ribosome recycling factor [Bacteroidetes bacterium]|nr:MAG: ribosome recycling factor [Bacteroidota bacterium]RLD87061.1 MAG: ribosome recycling factor [Bacteroidota bacterium]
MTDDAILCLEEAEENMQQALHHLEREFQKIRAGKASPSMLNGVRVDYYGVSTPIEQTANINTPDPRQIIVQPFDKSIIHEIEKAIQNANLGFNPQNEGEIIRINVPPLTEERRIELVKKAKSVTEESKVGVRNTRRSANEEAKKLEKDGMPEDDTKHLMDEIQKLTDKYIEKIDELLELKEKDIMTV